MDDDENVYIEDGLLERLQKAYEDVHISSDSIQVKDIESDYTGKYLAIVDYDGTVSIWEYMEDKWIEQTVLRYRDLKFFRQEKRLFMHCDALVDTMRPTVIARWSHGPGLYLAVASNTSSKAHVFGEHTEPPSPSSNEVPSGWHRKHSMASAGPITEMRFSPPHVEFTLATATISGMVIIHMLQDKNDIRSWRPIHAISVFRDQSINSLSWNRNPVHELPIIIASTDDIDAEEGQQVAVFAINSASVRPEVNMCFENTSHVSCVAFAPSSGLNDSLLAVASGRKISLYLMNVEEFQVPEQFSPSLTSETDDYQQYPETDPDSLIGSINGADFERLIDLPDSAHSYAHTASTESSDSPILPNDFFKTDSSSYEEPTTNSYTFHHYRSRPESDTEEEYSTEEEEVEKEPTDTTRKALMWNVKTYAVFRESCTVKNIQWGKNADNFTVQLIDGTIQGYKWAFGCIWSKTSSLQVRKIHSPTQEDRE